MIQKDKTRVDIYGERFRTRASQLTPGLRTVASYINEHREVVLEQTAMEIAATLNTSDATVIRAIQALGFAGLRDLKRTLEQWLGPALSSSEKMSTTVSNLTSDVNTAIDFVLEGHLYTCNVLSEPENRHALAQAVALLVQARQVAIFGIGASGILAARKSCGTYISPCATAIKPPCWAPMVAAKQRCFPCWPPGMRLYASPRRQSSAS